jgi:hypothetical protein
LLLFDVLGIEVIGVSVDSWGAVVVKSRHVCRVMQRGPEFNLYTGDRSATRVGGLGAGTRQLCEGGD